MSRGDIEARDDLIVSNHAQYVSVVRTGIGRTKMILGGEVDASTIPSPTHVLYPNFRTDSTFQFSLQSQKLLTSRFPGLNSRHLLSYGANGMQTSMRGSCSSSGHNHFCLVFQLSLWDFVMIVGS